MKQRISKKAKLLIKFQNEYPFFAVSFRNKVDRRAALIDYINSEYQGAEDVIIKWLDNKLAEDGDKSFC